MTEWFTHWGEFLERLYGLDPAADYDIIEVPLNITQYLNDRSLFRRKPRFGVVV